MAAAADPSGSSGAAGEVDWGVMSEDIRRCLETLDRRYDVTEAEYRSCLKPAGPIRRKSADQLIEAREELRTTITEAEGEAMRNYLKENG